MSTDQLVPASTAGAIPAERNVPWLLIAAGAAALTVGALVAAITWSDGDGATQIRSTPVVSTAAVGTMDTTMDTEAITRDLVERGLIPAASLSGG